MTRQSESSFRILPLLLIPLGFAVYAGALAAPFVFDDHGYIFTNPAIRDLSNFTGLSGTRYVGFLSFALNYRIGGFEPFDYHLVNVLIHIANSLLLYSIIKRLLRTPLMRGRPRVPGGGLTPGEEGDGAALDSAVAFLAAAVFLVHPLNTQAVTYITQRFTSLAAMFYLLSVLLYLVARLFAASSGTDGKARPRRTAAWAAYAGSLAAAVVAMKTKEISFTLPVVIVLIDYIFISSAGDASGRRTGARMRAPFYLTLLIIPLTLLGPDILGPDGVSATSDVLREAQLKEAGSLSRYVYVSTQFRVIMTYMGLLLYPASQYIDYMYPYSRSFFDARTLISFAVLSSALVLSVLYGVRSARSNNRLGVLFASGVVWFFITLSVESFLVPIQDVIFEHRAYLPGIGFITAAVSLVFLAGMGLLARLNSTRAAVIVMCVAAVALIPPLSYATVKRNRLWGDERALLTESLERFPNNIRLYFARALGELAAGDYERAVEDAQFYVSVRPQVAVAYSISGIARARLGTHEAAIADFTSSIELDPSDSMPYYNRALSLKSLGRWEEAVGDLDAAIAVRQDFPDALNERGVANAMLGRVGAALADFEDACRLGNSTGCENLEVLSRADDGPDAARAAIKGDR